MRLNYWRSAHSPACAELGQRRECAGVRRLSREVKSHDMAIRIVKDTISRNELQKIADERFGDLVKAAIDVRQEILALGAELHADAETELIEKEKSSRKDIWGINIYPQEPDESFIEFDSMINLKPAFGNRSRGIDDEHIRAQIRKIVNRVVNP